MNRLCFVGVLLTLEILGWSAAAVPQSVQNSFPVTIRVDAGKTKGELHPIYRFFGADEPNYATMKDGRKLLESLGKLGPQPVFFRTHNLLNNGDGTPALKWGSTNAYTEDAVGSPVYDWTVLDRIFDSYLQRGVRPYVEIGFMPQALSQKPVPYQHEWRPGLPYNEIYTGWSFPPKDYARWAELVFRWVRHCVDRYGRTEVLRWYWEVWNEPNIRYWSGSRPEFFKLHDYAIDAVRRALPGAIVGGPDTAGDGGEFMQAFLEHCLRGTNAASGGTGTPIDFISFHAKGSPQFVAGHVRMGIASQLKTIDAGFARTASMSELKNKPIIIGECDPDGCAACQGAQLDYRHGTMYSSYTAASFARIHTLAEKHGVNVEGALTWAFEFEDQAYFAGFRALASNGIELPVLNVFRLFAKMHGTRVETLSSGEVDLETILRTGVRSKPDVAALASLEAKKLSILIWHYHDDDMPGPDAAVDLQVAGLPQGKGPIRASQFRIDQEHGNAFAEWKRMGSPPAPTRIQYDLLEKAARLSRLELSPVPASDPRAPHLVFTLPRQAVVLLELEWD